MIINFLYYAHLPPTNCYVHVLQYAIGKIIRTPKTHVHAHAHTNTHTCGTITVGFWVFHVCRVSISETVLAKFTPDTLSLPMNTLWAPLNIY